MKIFQICDTINETIKKNKLVIVNNLHCLAKCNKNQDPVTDSIMTGTACISVKQIIFWFKFLLYKYKLVDLKSSIFHEVTHYSESDYYTSENL